MHLRFKHLDLVCIGVVFAIEGALGVSGLFKDQRQRRRLLSFIAEGSADLLKAQFSGFSVNRCLFEGDAVFFDGIPFALEGGAD